MYPRDHFAVRDHLVHHAPRHVHRHRESHALIAAAAVRQNRRIDADQFPAHIHQRAARIALIDRRIGLDEILIPSDSGDAAAPLGADNSHGHALAQPERLPHGQHHVADADFDESPNGSTGRSFASIFRTAISVFESVPTTFALNSRLSSNVTRDIGRAVDHVIVRHNVAVRLDDHARAQALLRLPPAARRAAVLLLASEIVTEELAKERIHRKRRHLRAAVTADHLRRRNIHHRRQIAIDNGSKTPLRSCDHGQRRGGRRGRNPLRGRVYEFHARDPTTMPTSPASRQYRTTRNRLIVVIRVFSQIHSKDDAARGHPRLALSY